MILEGLTAGKFIGGAAILGLVGTSWGHIKTFFSKCYSLIFVQIAIKGQTKRAMQMLLQNEFKSSPLGIKNFYGRNEYVRTINRNQMVAYEMVPNEPTIWWRGYRPMIIGQQKGGFKVTFLRGVYDKDEIVKEAVGYFNEFQKSDDDWTDGDRFRVIRKYGSIGAPAPKGGGSSNGQIEEGLWDEDDDYMETSFKDVSRPIGWEREELGQPKRKKAMDQMALNEVAEDAFKNALRWRDSENWFKKRSIPWKIGWLIHGPAGTGKTAFIRALGQEMNMPIISFDLSTMTNKDFSDAWSDALDYAPCIVLFEDIDGVFHGRENIAVSDMHQGLSFDCFLNTIDGVENTDGIFKVFTTNNVDVIDPALGIMTHGDMSSRPGRIDRVMEFGVLEIVGRYKIANRIFSGIDKSEWEHIIDEGEGDTGAQFQERCCRFALNRFWEEKK
jgi:hypothetical protein